MNAVVQKVSHRHIKGSDCPTASVKEIIQNVVSSLKAERYLDHVILIECLPSDLPKVRINATDLEEIFYNLIINAAQAMLQGGKLIIDASSQDENLIVSFHDTGYGIPEEVLPYVFEPFYAEKTGGSKSVSGLSIVKELMERNGGQISIQSKPLHGTTVTLIFPSEKDRLAS